VGGEGDDRINGGRVPTASAAWTTTRCVGAGATTCSPVNPATTASLAAVVKTQPVSPARGGGAAGVGDVVATRRDQHNRQERGDRLPEIHIQSHRSLRCSGTTRCCARHADRSLNVVEPSSDSRQHPHAAPPTSRHDRPNIRTADPQRSYELIGADSVWLPPVGRCERSVRGCPARDFGDVAPTPQRSFRRRLPEPSPAPDVYMQFARIREEVRSVRVARTATAVAALAIGTVGAAGAAPRVADL
jgi:hypothetical protein